MLKLQEEKLKDSSKKIKLKSIDGDVFEVDYDVAVMSKTIQDVIETYPNIGHTEDCIPLSASVVGSKILAKIIEYCKKHNEEFDMSESDDEYLIEDWDAEFVELDRETLYDLLLSSMYLNIKSLQDLVCDKIANMIKGKNVGEIHQIFGLPEIYS
jgi:S-phase kinase-associated protein 1